MLGGFGFDGRQVLVTGGTGALGSALVGLLLREGARCVVPCIDGAERDRFAYRDDARVDLVYPLELTDEAGVARLYAPRRGLWGSVHIAGGFAMSRLADTGAAALSAQLDMNLRTAFLCCRAAAAAMPDGGRIVNVAARPALRPEQGAGMAAYTASKAAVAALTQSLASELAPAGILVNAIAPSVLDTPGNRAAMPDAAHADWVPLGAAAELIAYLASPANVAVSGAVVPIYARA